METKGLYQENVVNSIKNDDLVYVNTGNNVRQISKENLIPDSLPSSGGTLTGDLFVGSNSVNASTTSTSGTTNTTKVSSGGLTVSTGGRGGVGTTTTYTHDGIKIASSAGGVTTDAELKYPEQSGTIALTSDIPPVVVLNKDEYYDLDANHSYICHTLFSPATNVVFDATMKITYYKGSWFISNSYMIHNNGSVSVSSSSSLMGATLSGNRLTSTSSVPFRMQVI